MPHSRTHSEPYLLKPKGATHVKINVVHTPSNPAHPKTPYPKPPHPNLPLKSTSIRQLHAAIVSCLLHHPSQPKSVTFSIDFTRDLSPAVVHKVNQLLQFLLDACDVTISSRFSTFTPPNFTHRRRWLLALPPFPTFLRQVKCSSEARRLQAGLVHLSVLVLYSHIR